VNLMAYHLTGEIRLLSQAITRAAMGDLQPVEGWRARGEMAELIEVFNGLLDTVSTLTAQVEKVAKEAGLEEKLAGTCHWQLPGRDPREVGSDYHVSWALYLEGREAARRGEYGPAEALYRESLERAVRGGHDVRMLYALEGLATLAAVHGDSARAGRLFGAAEARRELLGVTMPGYPSWHFWHYTLLPGGREILASEAFLTGGDQGRAMEWEEAVEEALGKESGA
jgi:hypothetical protein